MTQKKSEPYFHPTDTSEIKVSTRIENESSDFVELSKPRLGRRESEPHSIEVTYLHDVLVTNFPGDRAMWDLHHYFLGSKGALKGEEIDLQFDISFFKGLKIEYTLSSYDARKYEGKIPDMAVNVLSRSTWSKDLSETVDICKDLAISVYAVFSPYEVTKKIYYPPFLRVFILKDDGFYKQEELRSITLKEGGPINEKNIIDVSDRLPFRLGLMQMARQHEGEKSLFRLILIDPSEPRILLSKAEKDKQKADAKAKEADAKAKEADAKAKELEKELGNYRKKYGELD